jgi:hypothetical protein
MRELCQHQGVALGEGHAMPDCAVTAAIGAVCLVGALWRFRTTLTAMQT